MPLTMTPERFEEIRRLVEERHLAAAANQALLEGRGAPAREFTEVDAFLAYLDALEE
jgi:hypothetical protein